MQYENVVQGRFLSRPNRFIAVVDIGGTETVCHVKNTGRCRELLVPGAAVWLAPGVTPGRKTPYDLIAVDKGGKLINMDAQAPNRVFGEFARRFDPLAQEVRPEYRFGASRLDFCLTRPDGLHLVEVKGVTLESGGHARFPDAPTERGVKHLHGECGRLRLPCRTGSHGDRPACAGHIIRGVRYDAFGDLSHRHRPEHGRFRGGHLQGAGHAGQGA